MDEINFEELEKEIARREALDSTTATAADDGDYLSAVGALFRQNPASFIERHPTLANQLLLQQERLRASRINTPMSAVTEEELDTFSTEDLKRFFLATYDAKVNLTEEERVDLIREVAGMRCHHCGQKPFISSKS